MNPPTSPATSASGLVLPLNFAGAERRATVLLSRLTLEEKLLLVTGHNSFYLRGFPEHGVPELYFSDATAGVNIRKNLNDQLGKSTAFPCPLALAATWNPALSFDYARSIGEECRAGGIAVLLGPGMNIYRISQNGRNFEYFGEDPFLAARMVEAYVGGMLATGTMPTLKHFVANNTEFYRRTSNSVVDERTLHEIYLPAFKAGIDAGAPAVMTSYNQLNGEWCGQSRDVITRLLRDELGFQGLVMTDWWSVWDVEKIVVSGQALEMPGEHVIRQNGMAALDAGRISERQIDRMALSILRTCIAMGFYDRPLRDTILLEKYPEHSEVALRTSRESIVLLKNNGLLPLGRTAKHIVLTGTYASKIAAGGGSAIVEGYDPVTLVDALRAIYGPEVRAIEHPSDEELAEASVVVINAGRIESEGWDHPFELPDDEEKAIQRAVALNKNTIVVLTVGSGVKMGAWKDRAAAILFGWYPGQIGNRGLAEILCGDVSPSGKLPFTNEKRFEDSPGFGYIPADREIYAGWQVDSNMASPVFDIVYKEGVFVGYRWYEAKKIEPEYAFGHGLSYSRFEYGALRLSTNALRRGERLGVEFEVRNVGDIAAAEVAQLYIRDVRASVPRPEKELKGFSKVFLNAGERRRVRLEIAESDLSFWDTETHHWKAEPGRFEALIGAASNDIRLRDSFELI